MKILLAEPSDFSEEALGLLDRYGTVVRGVADRQDLIRQVADTDILIVRLGHAVDAQVLAAANKLLFIVSPTTGLDHIDLETAATRGVSIVSLRGETEFLRGIPATAELTWALILALTRNLVDAASDARLGHWRRDLFVGRDLAGKTLGVLGYGRIGQMVARFGIAFGMTVLFCDSHNMAAEPSVEQVGFRELFARAHVISVHVPLQDDTRRLVDRGALGLMRPDSILVNTSRGGVLDEEALVEALTVGRIRAAALDVIDGEAAGHGSMTYHPVVKYAGSHENLLITPHIGGASWDSMRSTELFVIRKLVKELEARQGRE